MSGARNATESAAGCGCSLLLVLAALGAIFWLYPAILSALGWF
jgi:hypothetical protein